MSAADDQIAETVEALALTQRATVYARAVSGGGYTNVVKTELKCSLNPLSRQAAATSDQRAELANGGMLEWERGYSMPDQAQVAVDAYPGQRWNVRKGTVWPEFGPDGGLISWRADVVRAS